MCVYCEQYKRRATYQYIKCSNSFVFSFSINSCNFFNNNNIFMDSLIGKTSLQFYNWHFEVSLFHLYIFFFSFKLHSLFVLFMEGYWILYRLVFQIQFWFPSSPCSPWRDRFSNICLPFGETHISPMSNWISKSAKGTEYMVLHLASLQCHLGEVVHL